ncbi:hypothetical protein [Paenibacillus sp.]|jgi:hypothetical protein|uniref:hypothetical protein n=1 Tax=Paenibacillus sp. TaxID=58172 RepID=UPI00282CD1C6|nr:hypothetical protein [Paenibacillus sp.]MDR0268962.1 hypothetical protein [Paenibacillus sp.]
MNDFNVHGNHKHPKRSKNHKPTRDRKDFPRRDNHHEVESAAEVAPPRANRYENDDDREGANNVTIGRTAGYVGLASGIASLFMWSIVLGPIAAIAGFYAFSKGSRVLGGWGVGLGILATLSYFILIPFR